jgi:diguanylate cyclase (GGDEF)-like protein/PAS domain S-box-containing protein
MEDAATILTVNDSPEQLDLLALVLRAAGYRVLAAPDGREGFEAARRERPHLIISDVMMPGVGGIELCRLVRSDPALRLTPILLLSALSKDTASVVEGLEAGADDYVEAPYDPTRLVARVARLLERARSERALRESEERFRLLVESVRDYAILMLDPAGRVASWNSGAERVTGYAAGESLGRHFSIFFAPGAPAEDEPSAALERAAAEGRYEREGWRVRKDGSHYWAHVALTPVRDESGELRGFAEVTHDITERVVAEDRLAYAATHDPLTGLPNRSLFLEHLGQAIARSKRHPEYSYAVLFLDLDRFKIINDSLGHVAADRLLVALSRRLKACLRPEDVIARFGGDEFTILLSDTRDATAASRVARRIRSELRAPLTAGGHEVFTSASIGIALGSQGYDSPEDCLRDADAAMYRAKSLGKSRHEVFDRSMNERAAALLKLETDLRRAVERGEFRVHYQPIVSLAEGHVVGFEALLRWEHPEEGLLPPSRFMAVAEETGLITEVGGWVLREACRQVREWQGASRRHLMVSVNLGSREFSQPDLVGQIRPALEGAGLRPGDLRLEITEGVVMGDAAAASALLGELKEVGVGLDIDDFGTGYSSLSYLHEFDIDVLKIDRSFIRRMCADDGNFEIVRTIVSLAHSLKLEVTAEGVETEEQLSRLRGLGCEYGQGYYFSRPAEAAAAEPLITRRWEV